GPAAGVRGLARGAADVRPRGPRPPAGDPALGNVGVPGAGPLRQPVRGPGLCLPGPRTARGGRPLLAPGGPLVLARPRRGQGPQGGRPGPAGRRPGGPRAAPVAPVAAKRLRLRGDVLRGWAHGRILYGMRAGILYQRPRAGCLPPLRTGTAPRLLPRI